MQPLFARLSEPGIVDSSVYGLLLQDYVTYHAVLVAGGSVFAVIALRVTARSLKALSAARGKEGVPPPIEWRRANLFLAITGAITALLLLLLVAINLGTVLSPREGFIQTFADAASRNPDSGKALSGDALLAWIRSGDERMPPALQAAVNDRLAWQLPKAVTCWILLALSSLLTTWAWTAVNGGRRRDPARTGPARAAIGVLAWVGLPICLLLMVLALANTQASMAPIVITLAAG